jgi:hypothetical protein
MIFFKCIKQKDKAFTDKNKIYAIHYFAEIKEQE